MIDIELVSLTQGPEDTRKDCASLIASFKVGDLSLQLVNMKLEKLAKLETLSVKVKELVSEENLLILFADFSCISTITSKYTMIRRL